MRGPVPKRSGMRHGHRRDPEVTKLLASPRWLTSEGDIVYGDPPGLPRVYDYEAPVQIPYEVRLPPGITLEPDPDEDG